MYYVYQRGVMPTENMLEEIVHRHYRRVFAYCLSILMHRERAEDACHDVFLKVQKNLDTLDENRDCTAWLLRIARNHCYDLLRKEKRIYLSDDMERIRCDDSMGPEEHLLENERLGVVLEALKRLKPEYREVLVLRDIDGGSYQQIASHLGMERKRVKWMLYKARQHMKRIIGERDEER